MLRIIAGLLILSVCGACLVSQPPPDGEKDDKKGDKKGGPPRYKLGELFPPHVAEELKLTAEQEKKIADLKAEVKAKLEKILTPEQVQILENFRPGRPGEEDEGKEGKEGKDDRKKGRGKKGDDGPPKGDKEDGRDRPPAEDDRN
ncbi:hypothetical protein KIH39_01570 [Telmatocola sphagniphila]|uniref:Uncharacterized protein n=1 Tax=Telmatocola sphagniphila TaxID=1123043 RepID=A0A8E6B7D5_9BACT|nr:hypothetical protein [Telmatocola sphagniphila]QVL32634.1 hypothetical protein KIH39_01570 [Telmatocola sphagniphila]